MNKKSLVAAVVVAAMIGTGVTLAVVLPSGCSPDPAGSITATQAGGIWNGQGGCFDLPNGLVITKPMTVENATFNDSSTGPTKTPGQQLGIHPVIEVKSADNVTIQNVNVVGAAVGPPQYNAALVGQAGYSLKSATNTKLINDTSDHTMGDCMTLFQDGPRSPVTSNLWVAGFTCSNPGRFGISPSGVYNALLQNVNLVQNQSPKPSIDFESDVPGLGAGAVTFAGLQAGSGVFIRETLNGPINFDNAVIRGGITTQNLNSVSTFPVTFNSGSLAIATGANHLGVSAIGGSDIFNGMAFTRQPTATGKPQVSPMWYAKQGASIAFNHCLLSTPLGGNDATSVVTITK